jgi:hypothetical protein
LGAGAEIPLAERTHIVVRMRLLTSAGGRSLQAARLHKRLGLLYRAE